MPGGSRHRAREAAVQALYQWDLTGEDPAHIEENFAAERNLRGVDRAYFHRLASEVPRHSAMLGDVLGPHLDRNFNQVDPVERAILRIGAFELLYQDDVPVKVIIDEAIQLARTFGAEHSYRFVNGVLDRVAAAVRADPAG